MASFNGVLATLIKGTTATGDAGEDAVLTGTSVSNVTSSIPRKHFQDAIFGVFTQGVSGAYGVEVVCSLAGVTYVAAGVTNIGDGSTIIGVTTGIPVGVPIYVAFGSADTGVGFTSTVTMAAQY